METGVVVVAMLAVCFDVEAMVRSGSGRLGG